MFHKISQCRICGNQEMSPLLDLGTQALTGVFPKTRNDQIGQMPIELVKCNEENGGCGLVQLQHTYKLGDMYGETYGYRSGLNQSMVNHLTNKISGILKNYPISKGDIVIDIGSNDATTLKAYPSDLGIYAGFDPSGEKFRKFYPPAIRLIPDFFSASLFKNIFGEEKAKIVTSIAMFYDLEEPLKFIRDISDILDDEGTWTFEQSYLPTMIEVNAYDTICHEHLEYYAFRQIAYMMNECGFRVLDVELNDINGGSFSVTVGKKNSRHRSNEYNLNKIIEKETVGGYSDLAVYHRFRERVEKHKTEFRATLSDLKGRGKKVLGYGASTKGNVILQYCQITTDLLPYIAEVNEEKFGAFTPATGIPIISEAEARAMKPDVFVVMPWHFKANIVEREKNFLASGGKLLFPLPEIHFV